VGDGGARHVQADLLHGLAEAVAVLGLVDGVPAGADHLHPELVQHPLAGQVQGAIEGCLPAHGRQQGIGPLALDDAGDGTPLHRLDVGGVRHFRVGHDGGRVGVDQDHPVALLAQRLAGLGAGIVELAGLADDDRPRAEDQDAFDVSPFGHVSTAGEE